MGGLGSGQWHRGQAKDTVERHLCLDIRAWQRRKFLRPGTGFSWRWWDGEGGLVASIHVQVQEAHVCLTHALQPNGAGERAIEELVSLTWTPCHYGGQRPWFRCSGSMHGRPCGRRVALLYGTGGYFRCRHCSDLVYKSQRQDRPTRLIAKAQQIRQRLGGSGSLMAPFPPKPTGMHWRTYRRYWHAEDAAAGAGLQASLAQLEHWHVCLRTSTAGERGSSMEGVQE